MYKKIIAFSMATLILSGCNLPPSSKETNIETSGSLHNYDKEMLLTALKKHPEFPELDPDETITIKEKNEIVTYFSQIEYRPGKSENNEFTEVEASTVEYFITLVKVLELEGDKMKSYWKYQYSPSTSKVSLIESEENSS